MTTTQLTLAKLKHPTETQWASGQPTLEQFAEIKAAGITHVINLRPNTEDAGFLEGQAVEALGLVYRQLPINGPTDLTLKNVWALDAMLVEAGNSPTLIHCASANRVGAMMSLRAAWALGSSTQEALAIGREYGLAAMEAVVVKLLSST